MASSQPSSPAARSAMSPDRFALSPQSRLKKLLATVDSDSDDESNPEATVNPSLLSHRVFSSTDRSDATAQAPDDEDDVNRPQRRLAARMQGAAAERTDDACGRVRKLLEQNANKEQAKGAGADADLSVTNGVADDSDDDIVRPRGRLAARMQGGEKSAENDVTGRATNSTRGTPAPEPSAHDAGDVQMADDDEDIPVRSRKLIPRQRQSDTLELGTITPRKEASPGLFVTPSKSPPSAQESPAEGSGSDDGLPALKSDRFKALVERKRQERLARETEEAPKKEARAAALEELGDDNDDDVSDITDDDGGRRLTQTQKPRSSRKASKKAMEEMNRETQRMQRAMQLTHEAKTKKKITKASLFERFNFNAGGSASAKESSSRPQTPASAKSTDAEMQDAETPPSSPPARVEDVLGNDLKEVQKSTSTAPPTNITTINSGEEQDDEDLPDILDIQAFARKPLDKGQGRTITPGPLAQTPVKAASKRQVRVKLPQVQASRIFLGSDDDDDLLVVQPKRSKLDAVFDRIPKTKARESESLRLLRQLAHLDSPERKAHKKTDKSAMTPGELQALLQQRAREQAKLERIRRLEMLKAKGVHIQTEEERERDREQIEDMVVRARREAEEIMQREREEAKKEKRAGKDDPLAWDESGSDDDYEENGDADDAEDEADVELSGSEEEDNDEGMIIDGDGTEQNEADAEVDPEKTPARISAVQTLVDEAAGETAESEGSDTEKSWIDPDEEEEKHRWGAESDAEMDEAPAFVQARRPKKSLAILSDDEDLGAQTTPKPPRTRAIHFTPKPVTTQPINLTPGPNNHTSPEVPTSVLRSAAKTFIPGMPVNAGGPAGLGLTQIFAGTMDDSQVGALGGSPSQPMPTFDNFPDSQFSQNVADSSDDMVLDSQTVPATQAETQGSGKETQIRLDFTQSQTHGLDSLLRDDLVTQPSQMTNLTQDGGFQKWTPLKERFVEPPLSTVETMVHDASQVEDMSHDSPLQQKRGRLRRKAVIASDSEDGDDVVGNTKLSAFNVLNDAAAREKKRKAREEFDRKKSKAKEMVEDQAEESEDEYAGLGGVDGEDSDDDDLASVHEMIDDQTQGNNEEDEAKIAALHAERERAEDARQTDKLFNDITRGMLRRKRGADYDLSDSDDGGEARRRMKRRQFNKMQKALFADERVSKVAENPRNQAFLRTIEDIGSDEEMDFLFESAPQAYKDSQLSMSTTGGTGSQEHVSVPDSQPAVDSRQMKQPVPAADRRTKHGNRPASLGEIRETLSNLLDEPSGNTIIPATDAGSDDEGGDAAVSDDDGSLSNKENTNPRRRKHTGPVVDRISLKRQGSSNVSSGGGAKMAFAAPAASAGNGGFKVPALLRRATTNSLKSVGSTGSSGSAGSSTGGGFGDEGKIKKNAGKKSGISYLARENDHRAKMAEAERRREERKFRAVEGRGKVVGGLFGAGKFE